MTYLVDCPSDGCQVYEPIVGGPRGGKVVAATCIISTWSNQKSAHPGRPPRGPGNIFGVLWEGDDPSLALGEDGPACDGLLVDRVGKDDSVAPELVFEPLERFGFVITWRPCRRMFHARVFSLRGDLVLVTYSLESILLDGVSATVLFASEFMILP